MTEPARPTRLANAAVYLFGIVAVVGLAVLDHRIGPSPVRTYSVIGAYIAAVWLLIRLGLVRFSSSGRVPVKSEGVKVHKFLMVVALVVLSAVWVWVGSRLVPDTMWGAIVLFGPVLICVVASIVLLWQSIFF